MRSDVIAAEMTRVASSTFIAWAAVLHGVAEAYNRASFRSLWPVGIPKAVAARGRGLTDKSVRPTRYFPRVLVETPAPPALVESALERKRLAGNFPA
jgi:hypothetical protein